MDTALGKTVSSYCLCWGFASWSLAIQTRGAPQMNINQGHTTLSEWSHADVQAMAHRWQTWILQSSVSYWVSMCLPLLGRLRFTQQSSGARVDMQGITACLICDCLSEASGTPSSGTGLQPQTPSWPWLGPSSLPGLLAGVPVSPHPCTVTGTCNKHHHPNPGAPAGLPNSLVHEPCVMACVSPLERQEHGTGPMLSCMTVHCFLLQSLRSYACLRSS